MSAPPFRLKALAEAVRQPLLLIAIGWFGIVAIATMFSYVASPGRAAQESAAITIAGGASAAAWLLAWRALAKSLMRKNLESPQAR